MTELQLAQLSPKQATNEKPSEKQNEKANDKANEVSTISSNVAKPILSSNTALTTVGKITTTEEEKKSR